MSKQPTIEKRRTAIKIAIPKTGYVAGEGAETEYECITVAASVSPDGVLTTTDIFYCEWQNTFGTLAIQLEQQQVPNPARIRMAFVKEIYDALKSKAARIYKDGNDDPESTYTLNSSVDNYLNENKMIEFNVKRSEVV